VINASAVIWLDN